MKISAIQVSNSRPRQIGVGSDNLLFLSIILLLFLGNAFSESLASATPRSAADVQQNALDAVFSGALSLTVGWSLVAAFSRWRLWRMRARPLPPQMFPATWGIIQSESAKMSLRAPRRVYWISGRRSGAAWVLGGFRRKLVLTGGLCVTAEHGSQIAEMIIRHELAHLDNKDTRAAAILVWSVLLCSNLFFHPTLDVAIGSMVMVFISIFLLQRREYFADARAINATSDSGSYLKLLAAQSTQHGGWFHPASDERARALLRDSPVLRANIMVLALTLVLALACCGGILQNVIFPQRYDLGYLLLIGLCMLGILLAAFCTEVAKGFGRKVPSPAASPYATLERTTSLPFQGSQSLAALIGAGEKVDWLQFILFLAATLALQLSYIVSMLGSRDSLRAWELVYSSFQDWLCWWLPSASVALILFRLSRDANEVAVGAGIAVAIISSLRPSPPWLDLHQKIVGAVAVFATAWFTYLSLAWAARVRRLAWLAFAVAIFASGLIGSVSGLPWAIGAYAVQGLVFALVLCGGRRFLAKKQHAAVA
jgi:Zn-dependent protease with chaperone function